MKLEASYVHLNDKEAKLILAKPDSIKDLECFVKKAFSQSYKHFKKNYEIFMTPFSLDSLESKVYGFYVEPVDREVKKNNNEDKKESKIIYETDFFDFLNPKYRSLFEMEDDTVFAADFSNIGHKTAAFQTFMDCLHKGYSWLYQKGMDVGIKVAENEIFDPFFGLFYVHNYNNLFLDPYTNIAFYTNHVPQLSIGDKVDFLLESFKLRFAKDIYKSEDSLVRNLKSRLERKKEQQNNPSLAEVINLASYPDKVSLSTKLNVYGDYAFIVAQISDIKLEKVCRQVFVTEAFNEMHTSLIAGVFDEIFSELNDMEVTTYASPSLLELYPFSLPVREENIAIKKKVPVDRQSFLLPKYVVDVHALFGRNIVFRWNPEDFKGEEKDI